MLEMIDVEEILKTITPGEDILCKTCKYKLEPVEIMGQRIPRYNYATCKAFLNKPQGVLWQYEKCELYTKE